MRRVCGVATHAVGGNTGYGLLEQVADMLEMNYTARYLKNVCF